MTPFSSTSGPARHRIAFLGPPGAGKGTQAAALARQLGIAHLSTGDLLRSAIAGGTELGKEAEGFMRTGVLVPDELVLRILKQNLELPGAAQGFVLDGYPRNIAQARALEHLTPVDVVVSFEIPEDLLLDRLTQRCSCPVCATAYNLLTNPPRVSGHCDRDGTALVHRPDDYPEAVRTRLRVYAEQTAPLLEYYRRKGVLKVLDATGAPTVVHDRLLAVLSIGPLSH